MDVSKEVVHNWLREKKATYVPIPAQLNRTETKKMYALKLFMLRQRVNMRHFWCASIVINCSLGTSSSLTASG